jgi:hypothetical protein
VGKKPESVFRSRIRPFLDALPNTAVFPIQQKAIRGDPDFMLCVNGLFVALELKAVGGTTDSLQEYKLNKVQQAKGVALVADPDNWEGIYEFLKDISCREIELPDTKYRLT